MGRLTLCDLLLGGLQMMAAGNLSDHYQDSVPPMLDGSSSAVPSMILRLLWGCCSRADFHGNSATSGGCWALLHLHDNCILSRHHDDAGRGGREGAGWLRGRWIFWLDWRVCGYLMSQLMIGQREKRDMRINVKHTSSVRKTLYVNQMVEAHIYVKVNT